MAPTTTLILGGGFGGISAANSLRQLLPQEHKIVVVNSHPRFYVGAALTWIMLGQRKYEQVSGPLADLLCEGIQFVEGNVLNLDLSKRSVTTDRETLSWNYLVIALGADVNLGAVPGLEEAAYTFYTVEGAQRLKLKLEEFPGGDLVILVPRVPFKCPAAPYEAAMLLHYGFVFQHGFGSQRRTGKVRMAIYTAEGAPMSTAGPEMGQFVKTELARREIEFHPRKTTARVDGAARRIFYEDGTETRYDLLIAVPPHEAPKVVRDARLTNQAGWVPVDPKTLQVSTALGADVVYAVGDIAAVPLPGRFMPDVGLSLPKAGVFAEAQGKVVAHRIAARVLGNAPSETFDGNGSCYLEFGGDRALKADGSFFDLPHPVMKMRTPDEAQFRDKQDWVARHLSPCRKPPK